MTDPGLVSVIGAGIVSALLFYLAFKLDESHWPFRLLCVGFAIINLLTIPAAMQQSTNGCESALLNTTTVHYPHCEWLNTNQTTIGGNATSNYQYTCNAAGNDTTQTYNTYGSTCAATTTASPVSVITVTAYFLWMSATYWFIVLLQWLFNRLRAAWKR